MKKKNKMVLKKVSDDLHPGDRASFLSQLFFWWQLPLMFKHRTNSIKDSDFVVALKRHESEPLGDKFEKIWAEEMAKSKKPSLMMAISRLVFTEYALLGLLLFVFDTTATFVQPVYLGKLLQYFKPNQNSVSQSQACIYGLIIIISTFIRLLAFQYSMLKLFDNGVKMRTACNSVIFKKILKSSFTNIHKVTVGRLVNLLTTDVEKFDRASISFHCIWIALVKVIVALCCLYFWFGYPGVAGASVLVLVTISQCYMFTLIAKKRKIIATKTDYRLRIMNDIITGIQAIKMYGWEKSFLKIVNKARKEELNVIGKSNQIQNTNYTLVLYTHKVSVFIFLLLTILGGLSPDPQMIYIVINIHDLLKQALQYGVISIGLISEAKTSIDRVQQFLLLDDDNPTEIPKPVTKENTILTEKITVKWDSSSTTNTLTNVDFKVPTGAFVAVVGTVGSGKSTLLQVILKEAPIQSGSLAVKGTVSYAPQEPWIFPATIKENIIFGEKPDEKKFLKVIRICALERDFAMFPNGENTLVGERGILLSGGQKARVSLARAIYRDADIYLLDDPLSAVDSNVAHQIFTECFLGYLKNKSVVFVTHQLRFLQNMDLIYILENGEVKNCGKYEELEALVGKSLQKFNEKNVDTTEATNLNHNIESEVKEESGTGKINPYKRFFIAGGHWVFFILHCSLFVFSQFFMSASDLFLSFWINLKEGFYGGQKAVTFFTDLNCLYVLTALTLTIIILYHLTSWNFIRTCKNSSFNLHEPLLKKTLYGTMTFFNLHSSGRVLNRFSRDMGIIDEIVPRYFYQFILQMATVVGVFVVAAVVSFWSLLPTIVICFVITIFMKIYLPTMSRLKNFCAIRKSPLLTHVNSSIQGLTTIRALDAEKTVLNKFDHFQNTYNAVEYLEKATYYCYAFWTDVTCTMYIAAIIFFLLFFKQDALVGNVGLIITQSFLLIGAVQYTTRLHGDVESQMICVKRIVEYSDLVAEDDTSTLTPSESWPSKGKIRFDSVSMRYTIDKPYILKGVTFEIKAGEKIGIIGRTGSGKSSLISTLFRLYNFEGTIFIDDVNIKSVALSTLRSKVSIIPQDPVLFLGTLRTNLDPSNQFSDNQLWDALEDVELRKVIAGLPLGLECPVLEGGANFSVGQRQMICLVRAILRNSKIVIFDEATAKIDQETDKLIQVTIRKKFKESTVLMIAHRLDTVMDSDKILVMDEGVAVEFDTKEKLLNNPNGYFYKYLYNT